MSAYEISLLSVIGLNVILAVSLNMISGFCGQISLGHGAFYGAGAYAAALRMIGGRARAGRAMSAAPSVAAMPRRRRRLCFAARPQRFSCGHDNRGEFSVHRLRPQAGVAGRRDGNQRHSGVGTRQLPATWS